MQVQSMGQEDPLKKETATHSSILAWQIQANSCMEPGGLQCLRSPSQTRPSMHAHTRYWWRTALNSMLDTQKNGPNGKTEQILFTLENMHQVDSSLLFSPRCDVTAAIVTGLFISSQILWCVFISHYPQMAWPSWAISLGRGYHQCLGAQHLLCDASSDSMHFADPGVWGQWGDLSWITRGKSVGPGDKIRGGRENAWAYLSQDSQNSW